MKINGVEMENQFLKVKSNESNELRTLISKEINNFNFNDKKIISNRNNLNRKNYQDLTLPRQATDISA